MPAELRVRACIAGFVIPLLLVGAAQAQPKLLFIGDSITLGRGARSPFRDGFAARIERRFPELRVVNAGCSGSTTRDWTIDSPSPFCVLTNAWNLLAAPELPEHILHVMLGTNDAIGFYEAGPIPPPEYAERLRTLVERASGLVLLSSPPAIPGDPPAAVTERLRAYRAAIAALVEQYRFVEWGVDTQTLLDPGEDFAAGDVLHPNDRGHTRIADALERRIFSLLPKGFLRRCGSPRACGQLSFVPRFRHPPGLAPR